MPTEAEWEYACMAGTITAYSFGDDITPKDANCVGSKIHQPVAVGSYKPNAFGLYEMHGNVWEWCEDWKTNYPTESVTDPKGPAIGEYRVIRGGSFFSKIGNAYARSAFRNGASPTWVVGANGFRLVRDP